MITGTGGSANDQEYVYYEEIDSGEISGEHTSTPFLADPLERTFRVVKMREIGVFLVVVSVLLVFLGIATAGWLKSVLRVRKLQNRKFEGEECEGSCSLELAPILGESQFHMEGESENPIESESEEPNLPCDNVEIDTEPLLQKDKYNRHSFNSEPRQRLAKLVSLAAQFETL